MTDYRKYNTNWTSPKRHWLAAVRDLRKALAAGNRAVLIRTRNEDCAYPIKIKNSITDFREYKFSVGLLRTRDQIQADQVMPEFQKQLSLNYKTCYGTPEAVEHYYKTGVLSHDNNKGVGTSHLVLVKDLIKFYSCHPNKINKDYAEMYRSQYLDDSTSAETHFYDFYNLKPIHSVYTIKKLKRKVWAVALLRDTETKPRKAYCLNAIMYVLKYIPSRDVLKMDEYRIVTYRIGSVLHGISVEFNIPKKFSFK